MKSIAIDGPAGAGKSTIARKVATDLGYIYVDTGALYRAVGLFMVKKGVDTKDESKVTPLLTEITVDINHIDGEQHVFLNNKDVSEEIRMPEISMAASNVSAIGSVRDFLFNLQRHMAETHNVVMDGRDIGTVVLPGATVKIFLTASVEDRAKRRFDELKQKGAEVSYKDILDDMKKRDYNDSNRKIAPLKQAEDAILADTTGFSLEQSVTLLKKIIKERL